MTIDRSISISKKYITRAVRLSVGYLEVPDTTHLSELNLNSIDKVISDLEYLMTQTRGVITWGVDRCMVDSDYEGSLCTNFDGNEVGDVPTNLMKNLMLETKNFKQQYQNTINLNSIVNQAFSNIKANPNNYTYAPNSVFYYKIIINNITVYLNLSPEDFNLSSNEYVDQLSIEF